MIEDDELYADIEEFFNTVSEESFKEELLYS